MSIAVDADGDDNVAPRRHARVRSIVKVVVLIALTVALIPMSPLVPAAHADESHYQAFYTPPDPLPPGQPGDLIRTEPSRLVFEPSGTLAEFREPLVVSMYVLETVPNDGTFGAECLCAALPSDQVASPFSSEKKIAGSSPRQRARCCHCQCRDPEPALAVYAVTRRDLRRWPPLRVVLDRMRPPPGTERPRPKLAAPRARRCDLTVL